MNITIRLVFATCFLLLATTLVYAQVGIGTATPSSKLEVVGAGTTSATTSLKVGNASSTIFSVRNDGLVEVSSTSQGFLPPRMSRTQREAITSPATGLIIYCTNCGSGEPQFFNGSEWKSLAGGATKNIYKAYHWVYNGVNGTYQLYSFDGVSWTSLSSNTPSGNLGGRSYLGVINGKVYHWVYNGVNGTYQLYSFDGTTWTSLSSNTPSGNLGGRSYLGVINGKAYQWVYNGVNGTYQLYSFDGTTWTSLSSNTPSGNLGGRSYLGVINGKVYHWVYNGANGTYQLYSFDGTTWTSLSSNTPSGNLGGWLGSIMSNGTLIGEF
jgi:hypothetical protein